MAYTPEDFKHLVFEENCTKLQILAEVCAVVYDIEQAKAAETEASKLMLEKNVKVENHKKLNKTVSRKRENKVKDKKRKLKFDESDDDYAADDDLDVEELPKKSKKKAKVKKSKKRRAVEPSTTYQELPDAFFEKIKEVTNGKISDKKDVRLLLQKKLYITDVNSHHNRISVPMLQAKYKDFLTEEETQFLKIKPKGEGKNKIRVTMIEPSLELEDKLNLGIWEMSSWSYVLHGKWNAITERNQLAEGTSVQLWVCDYVNDANEKKLCFALVNLDKEEKNKLENASDVLSTPTSTSADLKSIAPTQTGLDLKDIAPSEGPICDQANTVTCLNIKLNASCEIRVCDQENVAPLT